MDSEKQLKLRLPEALHARLVDSADEASRSLNAEIIWRLRESYDRRDMKNTIRDAVAEAVRRPWWRF